MHLYLGNCFWAVRLKVTQPKSLNESNYPLLPVNSFPCQKPSLWVFILLSSQRAQLLLPSSLVSLPVGLSPEPQSYLPPKLTGSQMDTGCWQTLPCTQDYTCSKLLDTRCWQIHHETQYPPLSDKSTDLWPVHQDCCQMCETTSVFIMAVYRRYIQTRDPDSKAYSSKNDATH